MIITATNDLNELSELLKEWTGKSYNPKYILWNSQFIVARDNGKAVGCAQLIVVDDPFWNRRWGLIENVYVTPSYRNKGVAKQIMDKIYMIACEGFACEFVKLTSAYDKEEAHKLYKSLGYEEGCSFKKRAK